MGIQLVPFVVQYGEIDAHEKWSVNIASSHLVNLTHFSFFLPSKIDYIQTHGSWLIV